MTHEVSARNARRAEMKRALVRIAWAGARRLACSTRSVGSTVALSCAAIAACTSPRCDNNTLYEHTIEVTAKDSVAGTLVPNATLTGVVAQYGTATYSVGSDLSKYPVLFYNPESGPLTVTAPGYATWSKSITVPSYSGDCKPINIASFTALMVRSP